MEIVIKGGQVIDPLTRTDRVCNVGIDGGKIAALSDCELEGSLIIDARGLVVCPGFIDIHIHEDAMIEKDGKLFLEQSTLSSMARMGVTTAIGGNCGIMKHKNAREYLDHVSKNPLQLNLGLMLGHGVLRQETSLDCYHPASYKDIVLMANALRNYMDTGCFLGLSFGLEYIPGTSSNEMIELMSILREYPSSYASVHFRFDGPRALESVKEMIYLSEASGVPLQISHIGSCCLDMSMAQGLRLIEMARARGVDVLADCYPYTAFCTTIGSPVFDQGCFERWQDSYSCLEVAQGKYEGYRCDEEIFNYLRANEPSTYVIAHIMKEKNVAYALKHPLVMAASDGHLKEGKGHPRASGTFPRILGKYVREEKQISLMDALYKMTAMPAKRLGLTKKGSIALGMDADITIFDAQTIEDKATFGSPSLPPRGMEYVLIGGKVTVMQNSIISKDQGKLVSLSRK